MKKLLCATVALIVSMGIYKVSAQSEPQTNTVQAGRPHGPPPNVTQAIALLDQAKAQSSGATADLIAQAEALLKQPPPRGGMGQGGMGGMGSMGQGMGGQMQGPPPQ
jgi:hypothetical protein